MIMTNESNNNIKRLPSSNLTALTHNPIQILAIIAILAIIITAIIISKKNEI